MAVSARIQYSNNPQGGAHLGEAVRCIVKAQQELALAKQIADSISGGGVTPANLEGSTEFGAAVGSGSALYTAIANMSTNLATVTTASLANLYQG